MKIAMLFPGFKSQFVGMGKELYDESRIVQEYFEEASNCLNTNFVKLAFASSEAELALMNNAYTAEFVVSCSLFALLKEEGIHPELLAGYNLGGYSALFAAGGFSFPDGLYLLNKYATLYQEALDTLEPMAIIEVKDVPIKNVQKFSNENMSIAIINSENEFILSGKKSAIEKAQQELINEYNASVEELPLQVGLHSAFLDAMAAQLKMNLAKVDCKDLSIPLINSVTNKKITTADQVKDYCIDLVNKPINWYIIMQQLQEYDLIIEIGPGNYLTDLMKKEFPEKNIVSINNSTDIENLKKLL